VWLVGHCHAGCQCRGTVSTEQCGGRLRGAYGGHLADLCAGASGLARTELGPDNLGGFEWQNHGSIGPP